MQAVEPWNIIRSWFVQSNTRGALDLAAVKETGKASILSPTVQTLKKIYSNFVQMLFVLDATTVHKHAAL